MIKFRNIVALAFLLSNSLFQTPAAFLPSISHACKHSQRPLAIIHASVSSILTENELDNFAQNVGVKISLTTLGPGYRAVARAVHDEQQILGYVEGFIRPSGKIIHVDKLEVWKKSLDRAKKENPTGFQNGGQVFGVSLLLGYKVMVFGKSKRCEIAEFLAIDDEAFQHKRLVRFFQRAGFEKVRYVGDDLASVPDRLVWGGRGTLMNRPVDDLLHNWSEIIKKK